MPKGVYDRSKAKPHSKTGGRPAGGRFSPEDAAICLTCTKKVCYGGDYCFNARKKKLKEKELEK